MINKTILYCEYLLLSDPEYTPNIDVAYLTFINDFMKSQEICLLTVYFSNPNITNNNE